MPPKTAAEASVLDIPGQKLDHKEADLFKQLVKQYEERGYTKALNTAATILKKFPDHGDTLAMKGLITNCLGDREEAIALVKRGLTASKFKSHVCWHVYGGIQRQQKNFDSAISCFKSAVKIDASNQQVWRELANLQMMRMDLPGLLESRHKLVELKSSMKANWTGYALAQHLSKNYMVAVQLLDTLERELGPPDAKTEISELQLYKASLMIEGGEYQMALRHMEKQRDKILDIQGRLEREAECHTQLGDSEKAAEVHLQILKDQPSRKALAKYVNARGVAVHPTLGFDPDLSEADRSKVYAILKELEGKLTGRDGLVPRLLLDFCPLGEFAQLVRTFLLRYIRKTIPSVFGALKSIYRYPDRAEVLGKMLAEWDAGLTASGQIPGESYTDSEDKEFPFVNLWVTYTLAGHHYRLGEYESALTIIGRAIEHSPTVEMLLVLKARILKHMDKLGEAQEAMNKARLMDLQDRYLNTKATKYCLRNNEIREAEKTIALFTTGSSETPNYSAPIEMQAMWYEAELGAAYFRLGDPLSALKKWLLIDRHFRDMLEDQFDFFSYCMRKCTLMPFIDVFRFTLRARGHPNFQNMARQAIPAYLELARLKAAGEECKTVVIVREDQEALDKVAEAKRQAAKEADEPEEVDIQDTINVDTEKPLEAAADLVGDLCRYSPDELSTHTLACLVYTGLGRPALILRHLLLGQGLLGGAKGEGREGAAFREAAAGAKAALDKLLPEVEEPLKAVVAEQRKKVNL